ncbi:MAG: hypothetical protein IKM31_02100 [Oscillospiraceae bacterium]|nr:hypothetical protein [Oscillospiraceae bacterium]
MAGWIILAVLIVLLSLSITVGVEKKDGELRLWAGYGPFRKKILPAPPKPELTPEEQAEADRKAAEARAKKEAKKAAKKRSAEIKKQKQAEKAAKKRQKKADRAAKKGKVLKEVEEKEKKRSPGDILGLVKIGIAALQGVFPPVGKILTGFRITELKLYIRVGGANAAQTAIQYGRLNAYIHGGLCAAKNFARIGVKDIGIGYDFMSPGITEEFSFKVKIRLGRILGQVFRLIGRVIVKVAGAFIRNMKSKSGRSASAKQEV